MHDVGDRQQNGLHLHSRGFGTIKLTGRNEWTFVDAPPLDRREPRATLLDACHAQVAPTNARTGSRSVRSGTLTRDRSDLDDVVFTQPARGDDV